MSIEKLSLQQRLARLAGRAPVRGEEILSILRFFAGQPLGSYFSGFKGADAALRTLANLLRVPKSELGAMSYQAAVMEIVRMPDRGARAEAVCILAAPAEAFYAACREGGAMKDVERVPLDERLKALRGELYHPLYTVYAVDLYEALAALDPRFAGAYDRKLAGLDRRGGGRESGSVAEFLYRAYSLSPDERRLVQYRLLIEPFVWLAREGGAETGGGETQNPASP